MSAEPKVNAIPQPQGLIPLMEENIHFYDAFLSAPNKQEKLMQLERALFLFIEILKKHESDPILKDGKIQQAQALAKQVTKARRAALTGGKSQHVARLHKQYQNTVKEYTGTTTQLQAFKDEFRNMWNAPPTPNEYSTIEATSGGPSRAPYEVPRRSIATAASQTVRRIFSTALTRTLLTRRESRARMFDGQANETEALEAAASQDLQTFHEILNTDPELRIRRAQSLSVPRPGMKPFEYPERSPIEEEGPDSPESYNRSTFIGQPAKRRKRAVMGHEHKLSDLTEALRIVESDSGHQDPGRSHSAQSSIAYTASFPGGNRSGYQAGGSSVTADHDQVSVSSMRTTSSQASYGGEYKSWFHASDNQ